MEELSLHIIDMAENAVSAGAKLVRIEIDEQPDNDSLKITVEDNGCGMDERQTQEVCDPFVTGRTSRRVGLGIPLFKLAAEQTGGSFLITSEKGAGTCVRADFVYSSVDRQPIGDISAALHRIVTVHEDVDFVFRHRVGKKEFVFKSREAKKLLDGVSFAQPDVMIWLSDYISEREKSLYL